MFETRHSSPGDWAAGRWIVPLSAAALAGGLAAVLSWAPWFADAALPQLEVTLTPSAGGAFEVSYDRGGGFATGPSAVVAFGPTDTPQTLRLPLPFGRYTELRLNPNTMGGRYVLHRLRVVDGSRTELAILPLDRLRPNSQATLDQDAAGALVVTVPQGATDPQLLYRPDTPLVVRPGRPNRGRAAGFTVAAVLLVLVPFVWLQHNRRVGRWFEQLRERAGRHPVRTAIFAGVTGALLATYPLLLGNSLVSPAIGPSNILYDGPPYAYGYDAPEPEDRRGTDTGAMMWQNVPYSAVQRAALAAGEAPLWNRYNSIGEPLWGQGQTFILDPFHLASLAIPDLALAMDLRFIVGRIIFAAGTGAMVGAATGSWQAGALLAFVAPFIGYFTARFNHPAYFSIVYAPWILWAYLRLSSIAFHRRFTAAVAIAVASVLQIVGSTPKEGIVTLLAAHLAGLLSLLLARSPWNERLGRLDAAVLGSVAALLLSAPHWLIFLDTLSRAATMYDQPKAIFAGVPAATAYALGAVTPGTPEPGVHALATLAAGLILTTPARLRQSGAGLGALSITVLFGAIAFGAMPGDWLMAVPLLGGLHHVGNAFLTATLTPLLLLAGLGVAWTSSRDNRISLAAIVVGTGALTYCVPGSARDLGVTLAGLTTMAAGVTLLALTAGWTTTAGRVFAILVCASISIAAGGLHLRTGIGQLDALLIQPPIRAALDAPSPAVEAMRAAAGGEPYRVAPIEWVMFPGTQALWRLESTGGADALKLPAVDTLSDLLGVERTSWMWRTILHPGTIDSVRGFLDMTNVRFLAARRDQLPRSVRPLPSDKPDLLTAGERDTAWPRAFLVDGVERHATVFELATRLRRASGPFASVSPIDAHAVASLPRSATSVRAARGYRLTPNSTTFTVDAVGPGLAVLTEAYVEKDFEATLNGRPASYLQVNHALKGVVIPGAGSWTVRFTYRPRLWRVSWALCSAGVVILIGVALARRLLNPPPMAPFGA